MSGAQLRWEDLDQRKVYTLLPLGSLLVRMCVYPASLVKTRIQAGVISDARVGSALRRIGREEGVRGLYRGFGVSLLTLPVFPVYFTVLERTKAALAPSLGTWPAAASAVSGALASAVGQTMSVPCDVVMQRRMMQVKSPGVTGDPAIAIARGLVERDGVRGLWRGYSMSLMIMVPSSSLTWSAFTVGNRHLHAALPDGGGAWRGARDVAVSAVSGWCAGMTTAVLLCPLDVVRTRMQVLDRVGTPASVPAAAGGGGAASAAAAGGRPGIVSTVSALYGEKGIAGFAMGWRARVVMLSPLMAVVMSGYELIKRVCARE